VLGALGSALGWRWRLSYRGRLPLSSIRGVGQQQRQADSWAAELDSAGLTENFFFLWVGLVALDGDVSLSLARAE